MWVGIVYFSGCFVQQFVNNLRINDTNGEFEQVRCIIRRCKIASSSTTDEKIPERLFEWNREGLGPRARDGYSGN